jgi:asparagine synthase (glutamine-hydrolysing)
MCGFIGRIFLIDSQIIKEGLKNIQHRGRDSSLIYRDKNIALGFNRLAIIDLSDRANQLLSNENESIWLMMAGENTFYQRIFSNF